MQSEITVTLKNDDCNFKKKFLCYNDFSLVEGDPVLESCVDKACEEFNGQPEDILIKITAIWHRQFPSQRGNDEPQST